MPLTIDDLFPPSAREFYQRAPLIQVSCQVRFPRLLSIESQVPAQFQEAIRKSFPLVERAAFGGPLPAEVMQILQSQLGQGNYSFLTADRNWFVTLAPDSLSLQTKKYSTWVDFRQRFLDVLAPFKQIYTPAFFSRIGLQYQDVIFRGDLGLADKKWSELIRPEIFRGLGVPAFEDNIEAINRSLRLKLPDEIGSVTFQDGIVQVVGKTGTGYLLDFDFFKEGTIEVDHVEPVVDKFNSLAGRAFRWCILAPLREALGPQQSDPAVGTPVRAATG